jgi:hypothetical protein
VAPICRCEGRFFPTNQNGFGTSRHLDKLGHHAPDVECGKLLQVEFAVLVVCDGFEPAAGREQVVSLVAGRRVARRDARDADPALAEVSEKRCGFDLKLLLVRKAKCL